MDVNQYQADLAYRRAILEGDDDIAVGDDAAATLSTTDTLANIVRAIGPAAGAIHQLTSGKAAQPDKKPEVKKATPKPSWFAQHPYATVGIGVAGAGLLSLIVWGLARRPARR